MLTSQFKKQRKINDLELPILLANVKRSVELLLNVQKLPSHNCVRRKINDQIQLTCMEILLHGLFSTEFTFNDESVHSEIVGSPSKLFNNTNLNKVSRKKLLKLIDDFEWLQRSVRICNSFLDNQSAKNIYQGGNHLTIQSFLQTWISQSLHNKCLCACIQALIVDKEILEYYYTRSAFLRNETYSIAFLICISAFELNQHSLLSQIDAKLYVPLDRTITYQRNGKQTHKLSISHPNISISQEIISKSLTNSNSMIVQPEYNNSNTHKGLQEVFQPFRRVKSLPDLYNYILSINKTRPRSRTMFTTRDAKSKNIPIIVSCPTEHRCIKNPVNKNLYLSNSGQSFDSETNSLTNSEGDFPRNVEIINCSNIKIWTDQNLEEKQQLNSSNAVEVPHGSNTKQVKNISGNGSPLNSIFSFFNATTNLNNSLASEGSQTDSSEAMASSSSVYPWKQCKTENSNFGSMFDSFLPIYGKKLDNRNMQGLFEDGISTLDYSLTEKNEIVDNNSKNVNDGKNRIKDTSQNPQSLTTFLQMAHLSRNNTELEKENAHFRISEAIISAMEHMKWSRLEPIRTQRFNASSTSGDWLKENCEYKTSTSIGVEEQAALNNDSVHFSCAELGESCLDLFSAEGVGLSLISKFNEKHLPKVCDLKWLVSEEDTPQKLLPMPADPDASINPDENVVPSVIRGTKYWAPPRPQIIFTDHVQLDRKTLIQRQNNRCAGCGMRVCPQYIHSFRYCTYLGKYHCTGCHRNQISIIPSKILKIWDFKCYPVSVFAYRLLEQMFIYPLFHVPDLNPALYVQNKALLNARNKRIQLKFVIDFIQSCRFANREQQLLQSLPHYISSEPDTWSISDFAGAYDKTIISSIDEIILKCENHVFHCLICTARGFHCEICHKDQVIYPWEKKTFRCNVCGMCFHTMCWKNISEICTKCQRMSNRRADLS